MNAENIEQTNISAEQAEIDVKVEGEEKSQYKRVVSTEEETAQPVDFRRVQHGHGPCACCGPYSE